MNKNIKHMLESFGFLLLISKKKTLRRKKYPYFTIYVYYAITESMYGYRDNEEQWKNVYYTDEFRYPIYA